MEQVFIHKQCSFGGNYLHLQLTCLLNDILYIVEALKIKLNQTKHQ